MQLREECFQRLDAARSQLLEAARRARTSGTPGVQAALRSIISDSSAHLTTQTIRPLLTTPVAAGTPSTFIFPPSGGAPAPAPAPAFPPHSFANNSSAPTTLLDPEEQEDILLQDVDVAPPTFLLSPPKAQQQPPELSQLSPGEYEDLMRSLEAALYEDMLQEEADYLDSLDQQDIDDMVEAHLGRMALGRKEENGLDGDNENEDEEEEDENQVLCPLCQDAWLIQRKGVILCPRRHLRLDAAMEGLQLKDLRRRLAAVLEEHSGGRERCLGRVVFEQAGAPGVNSLVMRCDTCGALEIVM